MATIGDMPSVWGISGNWAEIYQSCFVPAMISPWAPRLVALANPRPGERVLDVACGTGVATRCASQAVGPAGSVVGLDISLEMLAVALREHSQNSVEAAIDWREGKADALPFVDGSFDIVTCELGLMFFPDRVAALQEMRRVLAPGGRIALMTWGAIHESPGQAAMAQIWGDHISAEQGAKFHRPHSLHDSEQVRILLEAAGFAYIDARKEFGQVRFSSPKELVCGYGAMSALEVDSAMRDTLCAEATLLLKSYCGPDGLIYPITAVLACAYRHELREVDV